MATHIVLTEAEFKRQIAITKEKFKYDHIYMLPTQRKSDFDGTKAHRLLEDVRYELEALERRLRSG